MTLAELLERVAGREPAPGAGPAAAWACALAAALVEMVSAVTLRAQPDEPAAVIARGERAAAARTAALDLAELDVAAYRAVIDVARTRSQAGYARRLADALSAAADPPLAITHLAAEITSLAAAGGASARGGVRGEAIAAAVLASAAARAAAEIVAMNLAGRPADERLARARALASGAAADCDRLAPA